MYCQDKGSTASKSKEGKLNADARFGAFPFPSRSRVDVPAYRSLSVSVPLLCMHGKGVRKRRKNVRMVCVVCM